MAQMPMFTGRACSHYHATTSRVPHPPFERKSASGSIPHRDIGELGSAAASYSHFHGRRACERVLTGTRRWRRASVVTHFSRALFDDDDYDIYRLGIEVDDDDTVVTKLSPELGAPRVQRSRAYARRAAASTRRPAQQATRVPTSRGPYLPPRHPKPADDPSSSIEEDRTSPSTGAPASDAVERMQGIVVGAATFVSQTSSTASEKAYAAGHASRAALETLRRRARVEAWRAGHRFRKATKEWIAKLIGEEISTWEAEWDALGGAWDRLRWIWNRPQVERIRITLTLANFSVRVPALIALVLTQLSFVASTISLPMLAPLVLGAGIALKGIVANARTILPRAGLILTFLWVVWFVTTALQSTVALLYRQGAIDSRLANAMHTFIELAAIVAALMVILTLVGINVSGLLLPAAVVTAFACKDIFINMVSGFFLFVVQPFKMGDTVAVPFTNPSPTSILQRASNSAPKGGWFEGVCDSVDLRYTVIRNGQRKLYMPNSMFLSREFMVTDSQPTWGRKDGADSGGTESSRDLQREAAQTPQGRAIDEVWHETLGMPVPVADHRGGVYPVPAGEVGVGAYPAWGFAAPAVDPRWPPMPGTPDMEGAGQPMPAAAAQYDHHNMAWRVVYPGPRVKMGLHTVKAPPVSDKVAEGELQGEEEAASDEAPGVDSGGNSRNSANKVNNRSNGVWVNGGGPEP